MTETAWLNDLLEDVGTWSSAQFGDDQPAWYCIKGMYEEFGELLHSDLKRDQGIRLDEDGVGMAAERDAVGDMVVYCCDYLYRRDEQFADQPFSNDIYNDKEEPIALIGKRLATLVDIERGYPTSHDAPESARRLVMALEGYCAVREYELAGCVGYAWSEVSERTWDADVRTPDQ